MPDQRQWTVNNLVAVLAACSNDIRTIGTLARQHGDKTMADEAEWLAGGVDARAQALKRAYGV
jgi:hypothetical protein